MTPIQTAMALRAAIKAAPDCCEAGKLWKLEALAIEPPETDGYAMRMYLALKMLRDWHKKNRYDSPVVATVYAWIDKGMNGPLPWPDEPFFDDWAQDHHIINVGGFVVFQFNTEKVKGAG